MRSSPAAKCIASRSSSAALALQPADNCSSDVQT